MNNLEPLASGEDHSPVLAAGTFFPGLVWALSRLSMARGQGRAETSFSNLLRSLDTDQTLQLSSALVSDLWSAMFPSGTLRVRKVSQLKKADLPALYLSPLQDSIAMITAVSGRFATIEMQGQPQQRIAVKELPQACLVLHLPRQASNANNSASKLFDLAMQANGGLIFEGLAASWIAAVLGVSSAIFTMQVYDRVVPTGGLSTLWVLGLGVLIAICLEWLGRQIKTSFVDRASEAMDLSLAQIFFERSLDLRLPDRPKTVGTLASQIRQFESIRQYRISSVIFRWADLPVALFFLAVIWWIGGDIVVVPIALLALGVLFGLSLRKPIERASKLNINSSNEKNGLIIEGLDGIEMVRSLGCQDRFADRFYALSKKVSESDFQTKRLASLASNVSQSLQQVAYVSMVAFGAMLIISGDLTVGSLIACTILSGRALGPFAQVSNLIVQAKRAKIGLESLDALMALPFDRNPERQNTVLDQWTGRLITEALTFEYRNGLPSISLPALEFAPGQKVAVLGAVGSGKSTFLRLMAGLYPPTTGRIRFDSYDLQLLDEAFIRERIAYLPQSIRLFQGTLRDNLTLGLPPVPESELLRVCEATRLSGLIASHPLGLELPISEGGHGLSTGQQQLVGVTRVLLMKPSILLLDEPTSAMDTALEDHVISVLFGPQTDGVTVIMVTHKRAHLAHVERVSVMDRGTLVLDGPREDVLAHLLSPRPQGEVG